MLYFASNEWTTKELGLSGFSIRGISAWALSGEPNSTVILIAAIALFIAAIGKSGQFPLHTWLPDAMAGPTPVSSLLHSSTMVVAGVFLVARLYPVFFTGFDILGTGSNLITIIGGITIIIAAALAFVQNDIKKVLAYSTVSQLGYMMMGLGAGAWTPAVFHIFTHAFFKACLFLCAGSISHSASHHSFDMKKDMGGLRKFMPITFTTWIISTLALCGVFPFSGFFSKDEIIDNVGHNGYNTFMIIGLVGAFMTAAYMTRATYLTFFGTPRGAAAGEHHEEHDAHDAHARHTMHTIRMFRITKATPCCIGPTRKRFVDHCAIDDFGNARAEFWLAQRNSVRRKLGAHQDLGRAECGVVMAASSDDVSALASGEERQPAKTAIMSRRAEARPQKMVCVMHRS